MSACLFVLVLSPSPFATARDKAPPATEAAAALLHKRMDAWRQGDGDANVRLSISTDPVVHAIVLWNGEGQRTYPSPGGLPHVFEERVLADIRRLDALRASEKLPAWEAVSRGSERYYWCEARACAEVNGAALFAALDLPPQDHRQLLSGPEAAQPESGRFLPALAPALALTLGAGALLLWRRTAARSEKRSSSPTNPAGEEFTFAHVVIDTGRLVLRDGTAERDLSRREVALLRLFATNPEAVLSKDQLYDAGWGRTYQPNSRALDQQILSLRRKLDPERAHGSIIETVHGRGYRFQA